MSRNSMSMSSSRTSTYSCGHKVEVRTGPNSCPGQTQCTNNPWSWHRRNSRPVPVSAPSSRAHHNRGRTGSCSRRPSARAHCSFPLRGWRPGPCRLPYDTTAPAFDPRPSPPHGLTSPTPVTPLPAPVKLMTRRPCSWRPSSSASCAPPAYPQSSSASSNASRRRPHPRLPPLPPHLTFQRPPSQPVEAGLAAAAAAAAATAAPRRTAWQCTCPPFARRWSGSLPCADGSLRCTSSGASLGW